MINTVVQSESIAALAADGPTIYGLDITQLHDRYWASRGVQVVRQGERSAIVEDAELFLLTDRRSLVLFPIRNLIELFSWVRPDVLSIRIHDTQEHGYREVAVTDDEDHFIRFQRTYGGNDSRLARVILTPSSQVATLWQSSADTRAAWDNIRKKVDRAYRMTVSIQGSTHDRTLAQERIQFQRRLVQVWNHPNATIARARGKGGGVWADTEAQYESSVNFVGNVWIGAGRHEIADQTIVGPAIIWDRPDARPNVDTIEWEEIEPTSSVAPQVRPVRASTRSPAGLLAKRIFDVAFALVALAFTLPLYPLFLLAIFIEDGRPFFFSHKRETQGGREFGCLKFRSMRRNAEEIKKKLQMENEADGPQFFMENDPRITRVGRFMRKVYIDELPQFFNILTGDMSVVGPRPSPRAENQFCPPWRESRLSVKPGITGLWQVNRTRTRGQDFQEWIKFDIEYVENASFWLDMKIILKTIWLMVKGIVGAR